MDPASQDHSPERTGHGLADEHGGGGVLTTEEAWARVGDARITMLRIPTPFAVGRVNTFVIEDEPLTLVDTGPNSGKALDELETQMRAIGHSIEALERIVVTHQHIDHSGLVSIVARRSGAEVVAIDRLAPWMEHYADSAELDDSFAAQLMLEHGIPADMVTALRTVSASFRLWGAGATVDRTLADGELLEFAGRSLEVQLRPGHSPTDTLFWDAERRLLIGGDHLLAHISSNPLLSRPLDGSPERPRSLNDYIASLKLTRELPVDVVLPGHGEPVTGHAELIDKRLELHERRADKLSALLASGPLSAHAMAQELWGNVAVTQAFLTLSEVVGHMDLLTERGRVRETKIDGLKRFELTS